VFKWLRPPLAPFPEEAATLRDEVFAEASQLSFQELSAAAPDVGAHHPPSLRRERHFGRWKLVASAEIWRDASGRLQLSVASQAHGGGFLGRWWSYMPRVIDFTAAGTSRELTKDEIRAAGLYD
jgi:hypothetical protein